eukprot:gene36812-44655_t
MSLEEQLNLRVGLFAYDLIGKVIAECKNASERADKDEIYNTLSTKWRDTLAMKGVIPMSTNQTAPLVTSEDLKKDPRLADALPPVDIPKGLGGRPSGHMVLQSPTTGGDALGKTAIIKKTYTIKESTGSSSSASKRDYEELTPQQVQDSFRHTRRKKIPSATDFTSTFAHADMENNPLDHRQDVILGSLLLLDLTKVPAGWRQQHGMPPHVIPSSNGNAPASLLPVRVTKLIRKVKTQEITVTLRFSGIRTSFMDALCLSLEDMASIQAEPTLPYPHPALSHPFPLSIPMPQLPSSSAESEDPPLLSAEELEQLMEYSTTNDLSVKNDDVTSSIGGGGAVDIDRMLVDILGMGDEQEGMDAAGAGGEGLNDMLHSLNLTSQSILQGVCMHEETEGGEGEKDVSQRTINGVAGKLAQGEGDEEVMLLTGEHVSAQSIQELEEYYAKLKTARRRFYTDHEDVCEELQGAEDPLVPLPSPDVTIIGKPVKIINYDPSQWTVRLSDVYLVHEHTAEPTTAGQITTRDVILPLVNVKIDTARLILGGQGKKVLE